MSRNTLTDRFPNRAPTWQLRTRQVELGNRPLLMGIVNVTPDSFSDGGKFFGSKQAIEYALQLVSDGADILDIGGESTRPYSEPVSEDEELRRVVPVVESLAEQISVPISIDTSKSQIARAALEAGAEIVNDVTGLQGDSQMCNVVADLQPGVCVMHMQGTPQTMQDKPHYDDVLSEIAAYLSDRKNSLIAAGIGAEQICLDPGIGFGKSHQHNLTLMAGCGSLHKLGCPLLVGHSRKGFLAKILGDKTADRTAATVGSSLALAAQGVQIIRVHDVRPVHEALLAFVAVGGVDGQAGQLAD